MAATPLIKFKKAILPAISLLTILSFISCGEAGDVTYSKMAAGTPGTSAILTWDAPTTNNDIGNSCLTDLAGYNIHYGTYSSSLTETITDAKATCNDTLVDAGTGCGNIYECTYTVTSLTPGTWYFQVIAYDVLGNKSLPSDMASKIIE